MRGPAPRSDMTDAIIEAYRAGAFPMARKDRAGKVVQGPGGIDFYTCDPRAIVPLEPGALRWARSLTALVKRGRFRVTADTAFEQVVRACAAAPGRGDGDWINDWIIEQYVVFFQRGHAHSVEAWLDSPPRLVGGLYGVHIGGAFFGESMFSRPDLGGSGASKVCFHFLVEHLRRQGFALLDSQFMNPHMRSLGAVEIPLARYLEQLQTAVNMRTNWSRFSASRE